MEQVKDLKKIIQEAVAVAIATEMRNHSETLEKKIDDAFQVFNSRLMEMDVKIKNIIENISKSDKKLNSLDVKISILEKENKEIKKEHEILVKQAKDSGRKVEAAQQKIDDLEQYGRKTMIEINGFPRSADENVLDLTLGLAEKLQIPLCAAEIEACHRISSNDKAGIIVEFGSRKKRDEFLGAKKKLRDITIKNFGYQTSKPGKLYINESLTAKRKSLLREVKIKKDEYGFKFVWSKRGLFSFAVMKVVVLFVLPIFLI